MLSTYQEKLAAGESLTRDEIAAICEALLDEAGSVPEKAEFLQALRRKGETPAEVAAFVDVLLTRARQPSVTGDDLLDVCGTGGDKLGLFNISTASMFVVAGAGVRVVKHGNRGITSKSGGADVLEALGVSIDQPPERAGEILERAGCHFLFAPLYHPTFKAVAPVRKLLAERGQSSIFNMLGPLLNPARPAFQLAGVYDEKLLGIYAETFRLLGRQSAWAVHGRAGEAGIDEVSTIGPTRILSLSDGVITEALLDHEKLNLSPSSLEVLKGGDAAENARLILALLGNEVTGPQLDIVLLNAAASLVVARRAVDIGAGLELARESVRSGAALGVLERLRSA